MRNHIREDGIEKHCVILNFLDMKKTKFIFALILLSIFLFSCTSEEIIEEDDTQNLTIISQDLYATGDDSTESTDNEKDD